MPIEVQFFDAPELARDVAESHLAAEPVSNNLVLTLLTDRIARPQPGRYWIAFDEGEVAGMGLQSPLDHALNLTAMAPETAVALAEAIGSGGVRLPGVAGEARVAARFAGQWAERHAIGAHPVDGQRIYEARTVDQGEATPGRLDQATAADRPLLCDWMASFQEETGGSVEGVAAFVDRRVGAGEIWLWKDDETRSMAAVTAPQAGVSRVQYVYTPPRHRCLGYAEALVRSLTGKLLVEGVRPMLFTDLANPTSNGVYRRVGYRAVSELVHYRFDGPEEPDR